jgi:hypothetical protein
LIKKVAYEGVVYKILETGTLSIFLGRSTGYPEPSLTRLVLVVNVSLAKAGRFYLIRHDLTKRHGILDNNQLLYLGDHSSPN